MKLLIKRQPVWFCGRAESFRVLFGIIKWRNKMKVRTKTYPSGDKQITISDGDGLHINLTAKQKLTEGFVLKVTPWHGTILYEPFTNAQDDVVLEVHADVEK